MTVLEFKQNLICLNDKLSRFAYRLTANKDDAKDLLQETMLKALVYKDQFVKYTNLKAWTYTIMKNTFINGYRHNVRHNTAFDNTKDLYFISQNKDTINDSPDSAYATKEITQIIDNLDDVYKVPFKMLVEGYKYKEISEKLDLNIGTVKSRIFFTRKKLMDALAGYH
jgi:RNA polymerase sigma-70 factor, ECF subfamily